MHTRSCARFVFHFASRTMSQLACRFCAGVDFVHVVDPLLDLRYRFDDKQRLSNMLKARKIKVDVDDLESKYKRWWKAYEKVCANLNEEKRDPSLKRYLLEESEGLLGALRLPNDLAGETPTERTIPSLNSHPNSNSPKHMAFLRKAGMVKIDEMTSSLHTVGLPTSLQNAIEKTILQHFAPSTTFVSPPHMVRGAIIEAVNMPIEMFASFSDSIEGSSTNYLTGHGLISLLAVFTKSRFTRSSNEWPIRILSSGASYRNSSIIDNQPNLYNASQRKKVAVLSMCIDKEQERIEYNSLTNDLGEMLMEMFKCPVDKRLLPAYELYNYESSAVNFTYGDDIEIGRIGRADTYISNRLNIVVSDGNSTNKTDFVHLVYAELEITRLVGVIIEEYLMGSKPIPDSIRRML